jgi:hypothetical protein
MPRTCWRASSRPSKRWCRASRWAPPLTGTKLPSQAKSTKIPETLSQRLNKFINPFVFTAPYTPKTRSSTPNAGGGVLLGGGSSDPLVIAP